MAARRLSVTNAHSLTPILGGLYTAVTVNAMFIEGSHRSWWAWLVGALVFAVVGRFAFVGFAAGGAHDCFRAGGPRLHIRQYHPVPKVGLGMI
jgi:hypothetical protein